MTLSPIPSRTALKRCAAVGLTCLALLQAGCARHYTMTLTNGGTLITRGKPKLDRGYYIYRDSNGDVQRVNSLRVREISAN